MSAGETYYAEPCEHYTAYPDGRCNAPSVYRYPSQGHVWTHLCDAHGTKHARYAEHVTRGPGDRYPYAAAHPTPTARRAPEDAE